MYRERSKNSCAHAVTSIDLDESLKPFLKSARNFAKLVCDGIFAHATC